MQQKTVTIDITRLRLEERIEIHVSNPNQTAMLRLLEKHDAQFRQAHGSVHNHQSWPNGWRDHVAEGLNIAPPIFDLLNAIRPLPCVLEDVIVGFFVHDLEKPWKYERGPDGELYHTAQFREKSDDNAFRQRVLDESGIVLTPAQANAMKYAEGEFVGYSNRERMMKEAAAIVHACDVISARLWHDYPKPLGEDPWPGAVRGAE